MMKSTTISNSLQNLFEKCQIQEQYSLDALNAPVLNRNDSFLPLAALKIYRSTPAVTTHLVHPEEHKDPNYLLVAH